MTDPNVIVFIGDSLTEDGDWQAALPGHHVLNFGVGGNTTEDVIERLDEVVAANPTTVVVEIGTNDFAWRLPVEQVVENIEAILVRLREKLPSTKLVMQSILPRQPEYAHIVVGVNEQIARFTPTVSGLYVDLWPTLADANGGLKAEFTTDGLHLTDGGYAAWYEALRPALEA